MKDKKSLILLVAVLIFIGTAAFVHQVFSNILFVPIVMQPKWTASPTPTRTPTATPKPDDVLTIVTIKNSTTMNPLEEYISISNNNSYAVNMTDWYIKDDGLNRYDFPEDFYIGSKVTIKVWTMAGTNTSTNLFWDSPVEVWNDSEDCAYLVDNSGVNRVHVDDYCYTTGDDDQIILFHAP